MDDLEERRDRAREKVRRLDISLRRAQNELADLEKEIVERDKQAAEKVSIAKNNETAERLNVATENSPWTNDGPRRTLSDLHIWKMGTNGETYIWGILKQRWIEWEPLEDKKKFGDLLWEAASCILKVLYFCSHVCELKSLEPWISKDVILEVFTEKEWAVKIHKYQAYLHCQLLTHKLERKILPQLKALPEYPAPYTKGEAEGLKIQRMKLWNSMAKDRPKDLATFYSSIGECVDWVKMCERGGDDVQGHDWGLDCFAIAVELMHQDGDTVDTKGKKQSRNKDWEKLGDEEDTPDYDCLPLVENFGHGQSQPQASLAKPALPPRPRKRTKESTTETIRQENVEASPNPTNPSKSTKPTTTLPSRPPKRRKQSSTNTIKQENEEAAPAPVPPHSQQELDNQEQDDSSFGRDARYKAGSHPSDWSKRVKLWEE